MISARINFQVIDVKVEFQLIYIKILCIPSSIEKKRKKKKHTHTRAHTRISHFIRYSFDGFIARVMMHAARDRFCVACKVRRFVISYADAAEFIINYRGVACTALPKGLLTRGRKPTQHYVPFVGNQESAVGCALFLKTRSSVLVGVRPPTGTRENRERRFPSSSFSSELDMKTFA